MGSSVSFRDDNQLVFQQQIRACREKLDSETDRISKLPDGVLHHILSFIPTKEVVKTSILSTRWKNIWAYAPSLTLNEEEFSSAAEFIAFVDHALLLRDSAAIQKFHLNFRSCHAENFSTVDSWIRTAVRCNVVELDLSIKTLGGKEMCDLLNGWDPHRFTMFELPECLLTCKTLTVWKLVANPFLKVPSTWCYPSLRFLLVKVLDPTMFVPNNNSMDISHCPVLEYLKITGYVGEDGFNCNISTPALKALKISLWIDDQIGNYRINAPKLEKLDINEDYLSNYTFENTESLVEVNVRLFSFSRRDDDEESGSAIRATKFLAGISGVKCLTLPARFCTASTVAVFENLSKLTLVRGCCNWWKILLKFLESSPNLESLVLYPNDLTVEEEKVIVHTEKISPNLECFVFYHETAIQSVYRSSPSPPEDGEPSVIGLEDVVFESEFTDQLVDDVLHWTPPLYIPKCFSSSLKTISIHGFRGKKFFGYLDLMEWIKYFLKHGRVLEKMAVYTSDLILNNRYAPAVSSGTKEEFCEEFAVSELGSKTVQVEFIDMMRYRV